MDPVPPPTPTPLDSSRRRQIWISGILASVFLTGVLYAGAIVLLQKVRGSDWLGIPSCLLIPFVGGVAVSYFCRRLQPTIGQVFIASFIVTFVALTVSTLVFREGAICLIIVSPLFFVLVLVGALLGRLCFRRPDGRLHVSLVPLLAFITLVEPLARRDEMAAMTDEVLIRAPADKVWPLVTVFPEIPATPDFWLFRLGLPYPVATTKSGDYVNADRRCIFSGDAVFKETVAELEPNRKLTFDIIESPPDPELVGHLTAHRGQFLLRDNGDGTTTLTGTTWYTLHVRPVWYFDWWTRHIFRAVHLRVMDDIRRRAENPS